MTHLVPHVLCIIRAKEVVVFHDEPSVGFPN